MLTTLADGLWASTAAHRFIGMEFGARMTMVRAKDALVIVSPVPISDGLAARIAQEGEVAAIVCPNLFHHMYAKGAVDRFPGAQLVAPLGLDAKRKDLAITCTLDALATLKTPPWDLAALKPIAVDGQKMMRESVFLRRDTRSLITTDLVLNVEDAKGMARVYFRISGYKGVPVHSASLKVVTWSDKAAGKESLLRILDEDWDRLVLAHGTIVDTGGKDALRHAFAWLLEK